MSVLQTLGLLNFEVNEYFDTLLPISLGLLRIGLDGNFHNKHIQYNKSIFNLGSALETTVINAGWINSIKLIEFHLRAMVLTLTFLFRRNAAVVECRFWS